MRQIEFAFVTLALAVMCLSASHVAAQGMDYRALDNAASEIRIKKAVSEEMLARDRAVIEATYPDIRTAFSSKGFGHTDINSAVVTGWKDFRLVRGDTGAFGEQMFKTYVNRLGKIRIESEPATAAIEIDTTVLENQTNTTKWLQPGSYRIVLLKDGYMREEGRLTVVEGNNIPFKRILRAKVK